MILADDWTVTDNLSRESLWPVTIHLTTNVSRQHPPSPPRNSFSVQNPAPGSQNIKQNPHPGHNLPKISMKKEHNSMRAISFQIFHHCCPFDNFLSQSSILKYLYNSKD